MWPLLEAGQRHAPGDLLVMAGFWGLFKWPLSPKSEQVDERVEACVKTLVQQNKDCIEIIKEQRDTVIKATEALSENMKFTKELIDKLNYLNSADLGDVSPNYVQ